MSWCPKCKYEYENGIDKCTDCGSYLVDKLQIQEEHTLESTSVAFLVNVSDSISAEIIEGKLASSNIPVVKKFKESGAYLNIYMGMTSFGVDLYVPSDLLEEAKEVISEERQLEDTEKPSIKSKEDSELQVLEEKYQRSRRIRTWFVIAMFFLGIFLGIAIYFKYKLGW